MNGNNITLEITMNGFRNTLKKYNDICIEKRVLSLTNNEILRDIQEKVNALTFDVIKKEYDGYLDDVDNDDIESQRENMFKLCDDWEELETCLQIIRLFERLDITITVFQAYSIWSDVSNSVFASWLCKDSDDKALTEIITNWVYDYGYNN